MFAESPADTNIARARSFFKNYASYLVILSAILFFILFRWQIIDIIWEGRTTLPEPDDSLGYITHVRMIGDTGSFFYDLKYILPWYHADHLRYPIWSYTLATVKLISDSTYVDVYKVNFYFGIILLSFTLLYLLKVLESDKLFWVFAISFLTLYMGSGEYHGFYWVVPSFYSLAASLLLISLVFNMNGGYCALGKKWLGILFLITFLTIWSYPLGKISYAAIVLSFIIYIILNKVFYNADCATTLLRRSMAIIACGIIVILSLEVLPYVMGIIPSRSYSLPGVVAEVGAGLGAFDLFRRLYLDYFSFNSHGLVLLSIGLFATLYNRKASLFSLFLGFFTASLAGSLFNESGHRMLVYLWPLTFLIYSYGCYFLMRKLIDAYKAESGRKLVIKLRIHNSSKRVWLNRDVMPLALVLVLVSVNYIHPFVQENYDWNLRFADSHGKRMADWSVDKSIVNYLTNVTNPSDLLIYADTNAFFTVTSLGLLDREVAYADWDWSVGYAFLHERVNGSYLIATGNPKIKDVLNITEAFGGRLAFSYVRNFGILNVYRAIIRQTVTSCIFTYDEIDADLISEDFQTNFWSKTKNIHLFNDNETRVSGNNSLRIALSQSERGQNDYIMYKYDTLQDWSDKDLLSFNWYGTGSGKRIEILVFAPDGSNRYDYTFKDESTEWNRMVIPLNSFIVRGVSPSWSSVETIFFRFNLDSPYTKTYYLDRVLIDVTPDEKEVDVDLISDDPQTLAQIFLSFLLILFLPGLTWALYVFQIRDRVDLMAISFGLSFSLIFLTTFFLNLVFSLNISRTSTMFTLAIITVLPPALHYFNKIARGNLRLRRLIYGLN